MHALGRSVAIVYECRFVLAAHVSIMYTLQICLIRTNLKALAPFSCLFICFLQQYLTKAAPSTDHLFNSSKTGPKFLKLHKCGIDIFQTSKNGYIYKEHFQKISGSQLHYHVIFDVSRQGQTNEKNAISWPTSYKAEILSKELLLRFISSFHHVLVLIRAFQKYYGFSRTFC